MLYSIALSLLLGFELSYYLLIVQTGLAEHFNSDVFTLFPLFAGGVAGTLLAGRKWIGEASVIHKIITALVMQLGVSFLYPDYNPLTLLLLGISIGLMAPLGIYLFKEHQQKELFFALAIAYTTGTYVFEAVQANERGFLAVIFSAVALF
jgi:hypothetical protein